MTLDPNQIPSPVAGAATPPSDALSGNQADRIAQAAQTAQPTQQPTTPPPAPVPAPNKHEILGRLVSHIKHAVEGTQVQYVPDPNTGTVQESLAKYDQE